MSGPAAEGAPDDEAVLLAAVADLLGFVEGADDDRLDLDAAVQIEEDISAHFADLAPEAMGRIRGIVATMADAAATGGKDAKAEALRALAEGLEPDEDGEPSGDDGRALDLAVLDTVLALETLDDERLDPDDAMKALELAAWHLSHLTPQGRARFLASAASRAAAIRDPLHRAVLDGLADALDLAGMTEPSASRNADLPGETLITRKLVVLMTPKARDRALRQAEALRQNGYVGRWEVPDERQAARAQRLLREAGIHNIGVRVVAL